MTNIYELAEEYQVLQRMLEDCEDEATLEAVKDTLVGIGGGLADAVENSVKAIKNIEGDCLALQEEIDRLTERKRQAVGRSDKIKGAIKHLMELAEASSVKTALFTVSLAKGRQSVNVIEESALPDDMVVVKTEIRPDKKAIADAIMSGREVPGAELVTGEKSLRIK